MRTQTDRLPRGSPFPLLLLCVLLLLPPGTAQGKAGGTRHTLSALAALLTKGGVNPQAAGSKTSHIWLGEPHSPLTFVMGVTGLLGMTPTPKASARSEAPSHTPAPTTTLSSLLVCPSTSVVFPQTLPEAGGMCVFPGPLQASQGLPGLCRM